MSIPLNDFNQSPAIMEGIYVTEESSDYGDLTEQDFDFHKSLKPESSRLPWPLSSLSAYWNQQSTKRKVFITFGSLFSLCLIVLIVLLTFTKKAQLLPVSVTAGNALNSSDFCLSQECVLGAGMILEKMLLQHDPCDDFYKFSCGGFMDRNILPPDTKKFGAFEILQEKQLRDFKEILEDPEVLPSSDPIQKHLNDQLRTYYQSCMNLKSLDEQKIEPLKQLANQFKEIFPNQNENSTLLSLKDTLTNGTIFLQKLGIPVLFKLAAHAHDSETHLYIDQAPLTFGLDAYYDDVLMSEYQSAIAGAFSLIQERDFLSDFLSDLFGFEVETDNMDLEEKASKIVLFEKSLALISWTAQSDYLDKEDNSKQKPEPVFMTIQEIQEQENALNWQAFFSSFFDALHLPAGDLSNLKIYIKNPVYFQGLAAQIDKTTANTLQSYMSWQLIQKVLPYLSPIYHIPLLEYHSNLGLSKNANKPDRWKTCIQSLNNNLGELMGKAFVDLDMHSLVTIGETKLMAKEVKELYLEMLQNPKEFKWMDAKTKERAIEKLKLLKINVGLPEFMNNMTYFKVKYDSLSLSADHYWENSLQIKKNEKRNELLPVFQKQFVQKWSMDPQTIDAFYELTSNQLTVTAGFLQAPFFNAYSPFSMNLGSLGVLMAHEVFHAFDLKGRYYDQEGHLKEWWTLDTFVEFEAKQECFIDQYSNIKVNFSNGDQFSVHGKQVVAENLADWVGLQVAHKMFETSTKERVFEYFENLPGLQKYTQEQLFYIGFAQQWCTQMDEMTSELELYWGLKTIPRLRVNQVLKNNLDFAKAFQCSTESNMRPVDDICSI